jgi:DNA-directed RNA polymerase subunit RPC12/RpoP
MKKPSKRGGQPRPQLPECNAALIEVVFTDHLKIIKSFISELFTVPISKDILRKSKLFQKVANKFKQSLKTVSKQNKCTVVLTLGQQNTVTNTIMQEVYAWNQEFISDEQWLYIKKVVELDMELWVAQFLVKQTLPKICIYDRVAFTNKYSIALKQLREALLYLRQNNLLPKQNVLVADAVYRYTFLFVNRENLHAINSEQVIVSEEQRAVYFGSMAYKAVLDGYLITSIDFFTLSDRALNTAEFIELYKNVLPPPEFKIPEKVSQVKEEEFSAAEPVSKPSAPTPLVEPLQPEQIFTEDLQEELRDLVALFKGHWNVNNTLNERGIQLQNRQEELMDEFEKTFTDNKAVQWTSIKAKFPRKTLQELELKYGGPFWTSQAAMTEVELEELSDLNTVLNLFIQNKEKLVPYPRLGEVRQRYRELSDKFKITFPADRQQEMLQALRVTYPHKQLALLSAKYLGPFFVQKGVTTSALLPAEEDTMTEEEMKELQDLQILHTLFLKIRGAALNEKGEQLEQKRQSLFQKLGKYFKNSKSDEELLAYIQNYAAESPMLGLDALKGKYGGPFWTEPNLLLKCVQCSQVLKIPQPPPEYVKCPHCSKIMKLIV